MLRLEIISFDKLKTTVKNVLTLTLDREIGVPADILTFTVPYNREISKDGDYVMAYLGDSLVFKGRIDETINLSRNGGVITRVSARSMAGALLDCEAEPVSYINPADNYMFLRHIYPSGIEEYKADKRMYDGVLKIEKGMSHWQILKSYCRAVYGTDPFVSGDGIFYFKGVPKGEKVCFGSNAIKYISIKERNDRSRLISRVRFKTVEGGGYYSSVDNEQARGVLRERYVNAVVSNEMAKTYKMIENGNSFACVFTLNCLGCYAQLLGCMAIIKDPVLGVVDNLSVKKLRYSLGVDGEQTKIVLRKEV